MSYVKTPTPEPVQIIYLNGPPRAGKDTAAHVLARHGWHEMKLSHPLKAGCAAIFGVDEKAMEFGKDRPREELMGMTWRQAQIWLSEDVMKPKFGQRVFGLLAAGQIKRTRGTQFVLSDGGFTSEYMELCEAFGAQNIMVMHIRREGKTFDNDSRGWVYPIAGLPYKVANDSSIGIFSERVLQAVQHWTSAAATMRMMDEQMEQTT